MLEGSFHATQDSQLSGSVAQINPLTARGVGMAYFCSVHGLAVASELDLPELPRRVPSERSDVRVRLASLPTFADAKSTSIPYLRTVDGGALFDFEDVGRYVVQNGVEIPSDLPTGRYFAQESGGIPTDSRAARYLVQGGRDVLIDIHPQADLALVRLFLFGSIMGMICHQRGLLAMHASAVAFGNRVVAFAGPPAAGKSTLAAHCLAAGATLMADDVLVVSIDRAARVLAQPGMPNLKLWNDALAQLGRNSDGLRRDWYRAEKFHLPADRASEPLPLVRIYVLEPDDAAGAGMFDHLTGALAAEAIIANTYRIQYVDAAGRRALHFRQCAELANSVEVVRLRRIRGAEQLQSTAALVIADLERPPAGLLHGAATR
jgi:hypothetical protein